MTSNSGTPTAPHDKPPSTTVLRILVDAELGGPFQYGQQPMTIWVQSGSERPGLAAAVVRLSASGDRWDALGWSPDGPRELEIETSHDDAVACAIRHAREVANGNERKRAAQRRTNSEREQARWKEIETDAAPEDYLAE